MHRGWLLLAFWLGGCEDDAPKGGDKTSAPPAAEATTAASGRPNTTTKATGVPLKRRVIGRWKGPFEAEFREGGRYVLHAAGKEIVGTWEVLDDNGRKGRVKIVLAGLNSKDFVNLEFLADDEVRWEQERQREGAPVHVFKRVTSGGG